MVVDVANANPSTTSPMGTYPTTITPTLPLTTTPTLPISTTPTLNMSTTPPTPMSTTPPTPLGSLSTPMSTTPSTPINSLSTTPMSTAPHTSPSLFEEISLGSDGEVFQVTNLVHSTHALPPQAPVVIKKTQDKGLAMFATTKILPGRILMVERPLIVMPDKVYYSKNLDKIGKWVDKQISRLGPEEKKCFSSLTDGGGRSGPLNLRSRTFFTNDMNYGGEAGLFPAMARSNHSCCPNADFVSRSDLDVQVLVAVAPIEAGEEVCISYLPQAEEGSDVRKIRQNYLKSFYGFRCQCNICTMRGYLLAQNDSTRGQIREQQEDEDVKLKNQSIEDLEDLVEKLHLIGGKMPYILEIHEIIYRKAIKKEDWPVVVLQGVAGWNIALMMFGQKSPQEILWKQRCLVKLVTVQMEIEETEKTFRMFETIEEREQEFVFQITEIDEDFDMHEKEEDGIDQINDHVE